MIKLVDLLLEASEDVQYFVLTNKNLSPVIKRQLYNCSFRNKGLMYKMFLQHQNSATTKILSASINDKIIGWGVGFITTDVVKGNKKDNWTMMLYVFSNYRNRGIGKHILKWLKKNAPSKIDYVVYIDDTNKKFFKKTM